MKTMSVSALREYREKEHEKSYLLIDVRQPAEYEESHIPGSLLLPLNQFEEQVEELPEKHLIFYCKSGIRSRAAALTADFFNAADKDIYNLEGGMLAWNGVTIQGLPSFKALDLKKGGNEILVDAMNLEKGAFRFYEHLLNQCYSDSSLNEIMERVRDGELGHAKLIYSHLKQLSPATPPFDDIYQNLDGDILEGGTPLDEMVRLLQKRGEQFAEQESLIKGDGEYRRESGKQQITDILEIAIAMEYQAFDLYRVLSERTSEEKTLQEAFYSLSQAEKTHMNSIVRALEQFLSES